MCLHAKIINALLITFLALISSSCALVAPEPYNTDAQQAAIGRWNACLERATQAYQGSFETVNHHSRRYCEGYHRDVLLTFPAHLENQVGQMLSNRATELTTRYFVMAKRKELQPTPSVTIDNVNTQLTDAQEADL